MHAVQRERGVACGWVASQGQAVLLGDGVEQRRAATDAMHPAASVAGELSLIRAHVDASTSGVGAGPAQAAAAFHTAYLSYNALLRRLLDKAPTLLLMGDEVGDDEVEDARDFADDSVPMDPQQAAAYAAFAELKEATGQERALLCGILGLCDEALAFLPSRAFADLVVGLHQQRGHEATLLATAPPSLLELIRAGFEYSPELHDVQEALLTDFDVRKLRGVLSVERFWRLITDHIDKLEQLQVRAATTRGRRAGGLRLIPPRNW